MPPPVNETIASNEVLALFPTLVCRAQIDVAQVDPLNSAIDERISSIVAANGPPAQGERLRTAGNLHGFDELSPLTEFVKSNAEGVLSYLMALHDGIEITSCWADIRGPGARLSDEANSNAYLSALYFCRLPEGETRVSFRDPRRQIGILTPPDSNGGETRSVVPVREGTLLIFPGWLERGMERNTSDEPSVSLGFNLMFRNFTESMSKPLWEGNTFKRA